MFPTVPIAALISIIGGGITLLWYNNLSDKGKEEANRRATEYAWDIYRKAVSQLTKSEANFVDFLVRSNSVN